MSMAGGVVFFREGGGGGRFAKFVWLLLRLGAANFVSSLATFGWLAFLVWVGRAIEDVGTGARELDPEISRAAI
jgi:hypothetical protein